MCSFPYESTSVLVYQNILHHSSLDPRSIRATHRGLNQSFFASNRLHFRCTVAILKGAPTKRKALIRDTDWCTTCLRGGFFIAPPPHHPRPAVCENAPRGDVLPVSSYQHSHAWDAVAAKRELSPSLVD